MYDYDDLDQDQDQEYQQFVQGSQYWDRYPGQTYQPNGSQAANYFAPHSEAGDGYYRDHRHHLSRREDMRALELDPHHFYEVKPEPVHHEREYFAANANKGQQANDIGYNLRYAPHSESGDGYFKDHRHHLSRREEMRALELDPHHFYEVKPEPVHHEHDYFSDYDAQEDYPHSEDDDEYYEGLIGAHY
mmetsp:Transcript_44695/g.59329  ORF Transcript_44695/g.59329 Transcript_44695/m.59329 type:complete len:189 (+) Transcript_44695:1464-2030(+)